MNISQTKFFPAENFVILPTASNFPCLRRSIYESSSVGKVMYRLKVNAPDADVLHKLFRLRASTAAIKAHFSRKNAPAHNKANYGNHLPLLDIVTLKSLYS